MITAPDQDWLDRLTRDGIAAFVVEGDRCHSDRDGDCDWDRCPQKVVRRQGCPIYDWDADEETEPQAFPPAEFVAMSGPCETCADGWYREPFGPIEHVLDEILAWRLCPSCHGDRRKRVVVVEPDGFSPGDFVDTDLVVTVDVVPIVGVQPEAPDFECVERIGLYVVVCTMVS